MYTPRALFYHLFLQINQSISQSIGIPISKNSPEFASKTRLKYHVQIFVVFERFVQPVYTQLNLSLMSYITCGIKPDLRLRNLGK